MPDHHARHLTTLRRRFRDIGLIVLLLPLVAWAAGPDVARAVAGVDYVAIAGGKPYQPANGQVEVVEVFTYWCPHCAQFAPALDAWRKKAPTDVRVTYLPLPQNDDDALARGFFAASDVGALNRLHMPLFQAIHQHGQVPHNPSVDELADWYAGQGLDRARIAAAMNAPSMAARLQQARRFALDSGLEGTPTLIVDGRYRVLGGSAEQVLRNLDKVIAQARADRR